MLLPSRPLVPIALGFASGILLGGSAWIALVVVAALLGFSLISTEARRGWIVVGCFLAWGGLAARPRIPQDDISRFVTPGFTTVAGTVASEPDGAGRTATVLLDATQVIGRDGISKACSGYVECTLSLGAGSHRREPPDYGDSISARGRLEYPESASNPGSVDHSAAMARRGVFAQLYARRPESWQSIPTQVDARDGLGRVAGSLKSSLRRSFQAHLNRFDSGLLSGIVVGAHSSVDPAVDEDFRMTGVSHVLATAGLHVGIVAVMANALFRLVRMSRRRSAALTFLVLIVYGLVAGARPPIIRAIVVADILLAGYLLDRESDGFNNLAAAALGLLVIRPASLFDVGFQLSFATVATIIGVMTVVRPLTDRIMDGFGAGGATGRKLPPMLRAKVGLMNLAMLTIAAQLGSAPLVAQYFNLVSPSGLAANLLIVPALFPIIGLGLALWVSTTIGLPLVPAVTAHGLHYLVTYVAEAARRTSELPASYFSVPSPGWLLIGAYYISVTAALFAIRQRQIPQDWVHEEIDSTYPDREKVSS